MIFNNGLKIRPPLGLLGLWDFWGINVLFTGNTPKRSIKVQCGTIRENDQFASSHTPDYAPRSPSTGKRAEKDRREALAAKDQCTQRYTK